MINNTIVSIVKKESDAASDAKGIIERFSTQISLSKNSFTQLLGLEMQTIFSTQSSFVDSSLLKVSKEALLMHRKHLIDKEGSDITFKTLIKSVLIEHANLSLRSANLSLLNNDFLNKMTEESGGAPKDDALMAMNVFYNSVKMNRNMEENSPMVNFGDVFGNQNSEYFICITSLCDCLRPDNIKSNYFFAKGNPISNDLALKLGDSAFISFLNENIVVSWVVLDSSETDNENHKYKPVYIKPLHYNLRASKIIDNKIEIRRIITRITSDEVDNGDFDWQTLDYITTIRPNYTQRIANHTFTHPIRVGVDFVKKD